MAQELLALNLITRAAIVDGGFRVQEQIGRNRVFGVSVHGRPRFLVKQSTPSGTAWQRKTITAEATCLEFARRHDALRPHFPKLIHIDHVHQFIIQEFIDGQHLGETPENSSPDRVELAKQFGMTLARLHREMHPLFEDPDAVTNATRRAWILTTKRVWDREQLSPGSPLIGFAALLKQFPEVEQALDATAECWQRDGWIHHDIKSTNCLVAEDGENSSPRIVIVDWELARQGDFAWDLAGMIHSYLGDAIIHDDQRRSSPAPANDSALSTTTKLTAAMCDAYLRSAKIDGKERDAFLRRCLVYTGARLVQLASESMPASRRMTSFGLLAVQAGLNLMRNPDSFAEIVGLAGNSPR